MAGKTQLSFTAVELAALVAEGRKDPHGLELMWHAQQTAQDGGVEENCPYGFAEPVARARWLMFFKIFRKAVEERAGKRVSARAKEDEGRGFWWQQGQME